FAQPVGFRPLSLDLRTPDDQGGAGAPLIVFVHGGGWRIGSRKMFCPSIVAAGFAVASVEYRLSAEAVFPAQTEDVAAALGWLRAHGDRYGYDPSRVVLWGESAGATLAALVGLQDAAVRGIIDWYGPSDLLAMGEQLGNADDPASREAQWLGASAVADPERARAASPAAHVVAGAPPFLIAHGLADEAVPFAQSELLAARLAEV